MKAIIINKDSIIDHNKAPEKFAVTELRINDEVVWTNQHGRV